MSLGQCSSIFMERLGGHGEESCRGIRFGGQQSRFSRRYPLPLMPHKKTALNDEEVFVPGERPLDAVNIFGDLGRSVRLPNTDEKKVWLERLIRGEVGRDRFLILCALRHGNWRELGERHNYVEFQMGEIYGTKNMYRMLALMASNPNLNLARGHGEKTIAGEG